MDVFRRRSEMCDAGEFEEGSEGYRCQAGTKAINKDQVLCVFLASDADGGVVQPLRSLCEEKSIDMGIAHTMGELGKTCSIEVGAAAVAVLK